VVQDPKDAAFPELPENPLQQPGPRSCVDAKCRCFWMHWFVASRHSDHGAGQLAEWPGEHGKRWIGSGGARS
jgi:hypothetical protein